MSVPLPGEGVPEFDIQTDEVPELIKLTDQFDQANSAFLLACTDHASTPSAETHEEVAECGNAVIFSFKDSVQAISRTFEGDESLRAIASLMLNEHTQRVEHLRCLTPSNKLRFLDEERLHETLADYLSGSNNPDEFAAKVVDRFAAFVQRETNIFSKKVYKRYQALLANTTTVTIASEPTEFIPENPEEQTKGSYYAFSIEPPIAVHDPNFMEDAVLTFSNQNATHGSIWVGKTETEVERSDEEAEEVVQEYLSERFNKALNPLGNTVLRMVWQHENLSETD